jgi:hypothetical protein
MATTPDPDFERRVADTVKVLMLSIEMNKIIMSADQRVSEADAARLVGIQPGTLKNLRTVEGTSPPHYRAPVDGSRVSYRVIDLAIWIERKRVAW